MLSKIHFQRSSKLILDLLRVPDYHLMMSSFKAWIRFLINTLFTYCEYVRNNALIYLPVAHFVFTLCCSKCCIFFWGAKIKSNRIYVYCISRNGSINNHSAFCISFPNQHTCQRNRLSLDHSTKKAHVYLICWNIST